MNMHYGPNGSRQIMGSNDTDLNFSYSSGTVPKHSEKHRSPLHTLLSIIPTRRNDTLCTSEILLQCLPTQHQWLTVLQTEYHPRPLGITRIAPTVHRPSLHHHVPTLHPRHLSRVKPALNHAFENNPVIEALSSMHPRVVLGMICISSRGRVNASSGDYLHAFMTRCELNEAQNGASRKYKT